MRLLVDALGSTAQSGGMRLHSTQLINAWASSFPEDELHLLAPEWAVSAFPAEGVVLHLWPNERIVTRAPGQLIASSWIAAKVKADAVLSLSPIVTPFTRKPRIAFQHDWRHKKNPSEFPLSQRVYRSLWRMSANWATTNACISTKARDETARFARRSRTFLAPNGVDHARSWHNPHSSPGTQGQPISIVTYGHHNNKRPELVIQALAYLESLGPVRLTVLGAQGTYRRQLEQLADSLKQRENVDFPGFVSESRYQEIVSNCDVIALVSSDEGFGLPIAEAWWLGIPALVTRDSGVADLFEGYPHECEPTPEDVASGLRAALIEGGDGTASRSAPTWNDTAALVRGEVRKALLQ